MTPFIAQERALERAFEVVHGRPRALEGVVLDGSTDPIILDEALKLAGLRAPHAPILEAYLGFLEEEAAALRTGGVLPGVAELLAALEDRRDVARGLVTGNIEPGAFVKLRRFGLERAFRFGGYGSDTPERSEMVRLAVERSGARSGAPVVLIGDTPNDIRAARANGALSIAVATGHRYGRDELAALEPDMLLDDLSIGAGLLDQVMARLG